MNEFDIMNKRVLSRKIEVSANATCTKNFTMVVKPLKGIV